MTSGRLQAEIKQTKPFGSAEEEAVLGVLRTAAVLDHALHEVLRPFDLTPTQYNVLRILRGAGKDGLCGREVGERMLTRVPDVPRLLERMEVSGLVRRERDTEDRRHVTARITPKGLTLLERLEPSLKTFQRRLMGRLGAGELDSLIRALDTLRDV